MSWMRTVAGRLKSDYRYSKEIVYNNFPWPNPTDKQKENISKTAQEILDARAKYHNSSLADLYDELTMPVDTNIEDKEMYWNDMVTKLFKAFDEHMQTNTEKYLNMYIKNNSAVTVF